MLNNILGKDDILQIREQLLINNAEQQRAQNISASNSIINEFTKYKGSYIGGLTYPLKLNGAGGLSLSYNNDRIEEQIMEVLETRIGERIYRKFFGMPDLLFESISEDVVANVLRKQLVESIPSFVDIDFNISLRATEDGTLIVVVLYYFPDSPQPNELIYQVSI